jgi:hypothetical protein
VGVRNRRLPAKHAAAAGGVRFRHVGAGEERCHSMQAAGTRARTLTLGSLLLFKVLGGGLI